MMQRFTIWALLILVLLCGFFLRIEDLYRYPSGINDDEAADLVDAHIFRMSGKAHFLIFDSNPRSELLQRLIQGVVAYFAGASPFVIRFTGALNGVLGIAAAFWASRESLRLLYPKGRREWRDFAALVGAALLVFAMGYLTLSRSPYRSMSQIFLTLMLIGYLARALRLWRWADFIWAGICLGLLLHTYTAAYLLPLAMLPFALALALRERSTWKRWLPRLAITAILASLIILPIIIRLSDAPNYRLRRVGDVGAEMRFSINGIVRNLNEVFFLRGSGHPPYNTASSPLIPAVFIPFLALGLLLLLWRIRHPISLFLIASFFLLLVPLVVAGDLKHGLRISGEYAIFPLVAAFGAYLLCNLLGRFVASAWLNRIVPSLFLIMLFVGTGQARQTYRDYWEAPENYKLWQAFNLTLTHSEWFYHADRRDFAEWLISLDRPILIPADEITEIPTRVWLLNAYPNVVTTERFSSLPANTEFVMPYTIGYADLRTATRDYVLLMDETVYLLPPLDAATHDALLAQIDGAEAIYREGIIDFLGYHRPLPTDFTLSYEATHTVFPANFANQLAVINWRGEDTLPAHEAHSLSVSVEWTALDSLWEWYWVAIQLEAQDRTFVAREFTDVSGRQHFLRWLYPTPLWQIGDTISYTALLDVPPLEVGAYRLTAATYAIPNRNLPADSDPSGNPTIGWIKVAPENPTIIPETAQSIGAVFAESIELSAMELLPQADGQALLHFYWTSLVQRPAFDATIFIHLYDDSGAIISQVDARPQNGNYPTLIWDAGEVVMTEYTLSAENLAALNLRMGAYTFPDGVTPQRLSLTMNGAAVADDTLVLGRLADLLPQN